MMEALRHYFPIDSLLRYVDPSVALTLALAAAFFAYALFAHGLLFGSARESAPYFSHVTADGFLGVHGIQGRRLAMEDRFVAVEVDRGRVRVAGVLDGHGGHFAADFVKREITRGLAAKIETLKRLTDPKLEAKAKIEAYQRAYGKKKFVTRKFLAYLDLGDEEYKQISPDGSIVEDVNEPQEKFGHQVIKGYNSDDPRDAIKTPVLSSRNKAEHEQENEDDKSPSEAKLDLAKNASVKKKPTNVSMEKPQMPSKKKTTDLIDFVRSDGQIAYAKLLVSEIEAMDERLVHECKRKGHLGGSTLLLAVVDSGVLWVANVGDSRGILSDYNVVAEVRIPTVRPLSYDHKPSQLKERKRIEEAGGFVMLNGVWRVQGVLAVSRAMGDFPLKEKGVITAEPDVLSFRIGDLASGCVAILATDGLWDVFSNENAAAVVRRFLTQRPGDLDGAARRLVELAYERDSTDNVTVMIIDLDKA